MLIGSILMTIFTFPFFFYNTVTLMFIGFLFFGFGLGSYWTLISAVLADIIDDSVVKYKKREEGIYNGFLQFFGRLGLLFQVVIFALVHTLTNLQEGTGHVGQPESAFFGVLLHFSIIPAIVMLIGTLIFWRYYKLTPDIVAENQLKVKELGL
jgi:Na+/melibiose symporter-like transporter